MNEVMEPFKQNNVLEGHYEGKREKHLISTDT